MSDFWREELDDCDYETELHFTMQLLKETPAAILVRGDDGEPEIWLPKSQITIQYPRTGQSPITVNSVLKPMLIEVDVPEWLAIEKDLC